MSTALMDPRPLPPARLTSYRYWEGRPAEELRAVRAKLDLVLDDMTRQFDLFAIPQEGATAPSIPAAIVGKNETLGCILSPSQANTYLTCSAKWWFKYGLGLPDPKGGSFVRGLAVHKVIETWYKLSMAGAAPDIEDMSEPYDDAWDALSAEASFSADDDIDELKRQGAQLLRRYLEDVAPHIHPAALETRVAGEIGGVKVQGYIDILDVDGRVIDVKTSAKSPSGVDPSYAFQLATYRQLCPGANGKVRLDTLVATKTPKMVTTEYEVTPADQLMTHNLYPRVREGIREGLYLPNRGCNLCSRKYCNFADACCKEFGGKV
jgi:CRISPR/Cas system-associated exonuclease Cas4 (RecB family)